MTNQVALTQIGDWGYGAGLESGGTYQALVSASTWPSATPTGSGTVLSGPASTSLTGTLPQINADVAAVSGVTTANTNNCLQLANLGSAYIAVFNPSAQTILVYPPLSGTINGQAVNLPFGITAGKSTTFISPITSTGPNATPDGYTWFAAHAG